jgi:uncharacterized protein YkwD
MKNKILLAIAILLSVSTQVLGQSTLETSVLKELNHYRDSLGLKPVVYSAEITKAAKHHTQWMASANVCTHYETSDVPGIKTLKSPDDRGNYYGLLKAVNSYEEICSQVKAFSGNFFTATKKSDAVLGKDIIIIFSESSEHNKSLLTPISPGTVVSVGISVIIKGEIAYTTIYFIEK